MKPLHALDMAVRIVPHNGGSRATIAIDYAMPTQVRERALAGALGLMYARWCVRQMARDLVLRFDGRQRSCRAR